MKYLIEAVLINEKGNYMKRLLFSICLTIFLFGSTAFASPVHYSYISATDYAAHQKTITLIDVRSAGSIEENKGTVKGEIWIDPTKTKPLEDFIANHDKDAAYAVYCSCYDDNYAIRATQILTKRGFTNIKVVKGGWVALHDAGVKFISKKGID